MAPEQLHTGEQEDFPGAITLEAFWQDYGESCGFERDELERMWHDAASLYCDDLPYHNFSHVVETLVIAQQLADDAEANVTPLSRRALTIAALFHDAGYAKDHKELGFKTKEEYSAKLMLEHADRYGLSSSEGVIANKAILATQLGHKPETVEDKILVRSDLDNVAGDYEGFLHKTNLLRKEAKQLDGYKGDAIFAATSIRVLAEYASNDLSLGEWETNHWTLKAARNIRTLAVELSKQQGVSVTNYIKGLGSAALNKLLQRHESE